MAGSGSGWSGTAAWISYTHTQKAIPQGRWPRQLVGVVHGISEREDEFLLGDRYMPLRGRDHVVDSRDGMTWKISAGSFY